MARSEAHLRRLLQRRAVACPGCGYAMKGLPSTTCPECGRKLNWIDVDTPDLSLSWRESAFDVFGLVVTVGVNLVLLVVTAVAVLGFLKDSWFTAEVFSLGRGPKSISGLLLIVLGLSLGAWAWAWERSSMTSYRVQRAVAVWCWVLTGFHAVGAATVVV